MSFVVVGARQGGVFREKYFEAVLKIDPAWLDTRTIAEIPGSIATDTLKIERATGDKLVILIFTFSMILASAILAIIEGLQLTLVTLCFGPIIIYGLYILNKGSEQNAKASDTSYRAAGGIAEEALQEIKTVACLNGQKYETKKYVKSLSGSQNYMRTFGLKTGFGLGVAMIGFFLMMAACFMVGSKFMNDNVANWTDDNDYNIGKIIIVMFVGALSFNNMGTLIPCFNMAKEGQISAARIFKILNEKSKLTHGVLKDTISGSVRFEDVQFSYPSSPETKILKGLSFKLNQGDRLGIVGSTGSGKSTVIQILLRYYEPNSGKVYIDDKNITSFDIAYLRENISVVSQEPVLFNATIYENIKYGKFSANKEQIEEAAKLSGAMEFINQLPDGFDTNCGTKGSHLSGGQKQRIAIARAIIRKPKILLLDEATSALDRNTEKAVVESLENSLAECTRITVAQNLLTVKNSTRIIMIEKGEVIESGSHKKLIKKDGQYSKLYKMQEVQAGNQDEAQIKAKDTDSAIPTEQAADLAEEKKLQDIAMKKMMFLGKSERNWLLFGCFGSTLVGIFYPLTGAMIGLEIGVLGSAYSSDRFDNSIQYG